MTTTKTDIARAEIVKYLKSLNGKKIRQKDLREHLLNNCDAELTEGVIRGIFYRMENGNPIPCIKTVKENNRSYYYYDPTDGLHFTDDSIMGQIKQKINEFEDNLKTSGLLKVFILDLTPEERKAYLKFIEKYEDLKGIFQQSNQPTN